MAMQRRIIPADDRWPDDCADGTQSSARMPRRSRAAAGPPPSYSPPLLSSFLSSLRPSLPVTNGPKGAAAGSGRGSTSRRTAPTPKPSSWPRAATPRSTAASGISCSRGEILFMDTRMFMIHLVVVMLVVVVAVIVLAVVGGDVVGGDSGGVVVGSVVVAPVVLAAVHFLGRAGARHQRQRAAS